VSENIIQQLRTIGDLLLFLGGHRVAIVKAVHSTQPNFSNSLIELFGKQLKGKMSYGWINLDEIDFNTVEARLLIQKWMSQIGLRYRKRIPPGYYLFKNTDAFGYHPGTVDPQIQALFTLVGGIGAILVGLASKDASQGFDFFAKSFEMGQAANVYGFFSKRLGQQGRPGSSERRSRQQRQVYNDELSKAYRLLGVPRNASLTQIRRARLDLLKKFHPDKNRDNFDKYNRLAQEINHAYELIVNSREST